ncbi:hypothetical protein V5T82_11420 [Magnetovibrio sp. PR-2]|uniref:hypothetical protein n=1 Tax=Magnetovibrio sp. PR-2 TaxID=3120356 RepID=UPI002FCDE954
MMQTQLKRDRSNLTESQSLLAVLACNLAAKRGLIDLGPLVAGALLLVVSLFPHFSFAETSDQPSIQALVQKAKVAFEAQDEQSLDLILDRILERVTGFPSASTGVPEGVSDDEYIEKMCAYDRITQPIYSAEFLDVLRHQSAFLAYIAVDEGSEHDVWMRAITECRLTDGRPTIISRFMQDGIDWATKFKSADAKKALRMAQEIKKRSEENPKIRELVTFAKLVGFDAQDKQKRALPERSNKRFSQAVLVDKADKGDLHAQFELARRLEIGDQFHQDISMAYFWYQRAHKNGGGEEALSRMNGILPHLSKGDLAVIEIWVKNNFRPYL